MKNTLGSLEKHTLKTTTAKSSIAGIQIAGIVFVIIFSALLISNILISNSLKDDSSGINIAGRQRMLSQRLTKSINALKSGLETNDAKLANKSQKEVALAFHLFNNTLISFRDGGTTTGATGDPVKLTAISDKEIREHVTKASDLWEPIAPNILYIATDNLKNLDVKRVEQAAQSLTENNLTLLALMNNLTVGLEQTANQKSSTLKTILFAALILVFANFAYIVLYAVKSLKKRDTQLQTYSTNLEKNFSELQQTNNVLESTQTELYDTNGALQEALSSVRNISDQAQNRANELETLTLDLNKLKEESDTIFNSVDHGLCLLDKNHKIGQRVSRTMYDIFETEYLTDRPFQSLLKPLITEKDLKTLDSYLKLQFSPNTLTSELDRYNPLKQIEVALSWDEDHFSTKHLGFEFERVMDGEDIAAVLVTITDVTETVALESKLQRASETQERKTDLILEIIGSDTAELELFLAQSEKTLNQINDKLKENELNNEGAESSKELVEEVFRMVHNMKGNASMIKLTSMTNLLHKVESNLANLRSKKVVHGEEFLSALVQLATLRERLNDYDEITQTILKDFALPNTQGNTPEVKPLSKSEQLAKELETFNTSVASEYGKKVFTRCNLDMNDMSSEGFSTMKDIMIQIARNSIVHGIELPEERIEKKKLAEGMVSFLCERQEGQSNILEQPSYYFAFRDDGAGLDLDFIKAKALQRGLKTQEELDQLSNAEIVEIIFESSFSTLDQANEHAGRGMGMDIIKHKIVQELKGKLTISFSPGRHMQLGCYIPINSLNQSIDYIKTA